MTRFSIARRRVLAIGPGALAVLAGCRPEQAPQQLVSNRRSLDVHCHVFNARDIPVEPFIREVVLRKYKIAVPVAEPVVLLAQAIIELGAISASQEAAELRGQVSIAATAGAQELPSPSDDRGLILDRVTRAIVNLRNGRVSRQPGIMLDQTPPRRRTTPDLEEFLRDRVARAPFIPPAVLPQGTDRPAGVRATVSPDAAAEAIAAIPDDVRGVLLLASLVTLRRAALADRLRHLPRSGSDEIVFFTPAMVDYGYWLGAEHATTSLADQADVMAAIAARTDAGYAVHPYVSFCPWRQIMEPGQLDVVKDALNSKGAIGVKLYPVMGFRPYRNTDPSAGKYPERLTSLGEDWAVRLDQALADLYDFCVSQDVPLLAHCAESQDTSDEAGERASPACWHLALQEPQWKMLRVNLGHFGGIWSLTTPNEDGWTADAVDLMNLYPNVYADVADHSAVVGVNDTERKDERVIIGNLSRIFDAHDPKRVARGKLMYGTDWVMLSRDPEVDAYYPKMKSEFVPALNLTGAEADGFLGKNAAHFLGVARTKDNPAPKTRGRLEVFYKANGLNPAVLATWDEVAV